ncbi:uncharacterized protein LOC120492788 [Pimephales promelas]|uniref:uncharacterized protein LOC120492788 n=1 Tax=Pimephales promelas TaxID=90988 RepID=UPI0019558D9E|nr:uncharacterized protein LOC120492788 [Pimephales promelas]
MLNIGETHWMWMCETHPVGTALKPVEGIKGGNVTLRCEQDKDISDIRYVRRGKSTHFSDIPECLNEEYKHDSGQVCKTGACDIILKHLTFSDSGTHLLRFYYNNSPQELKFHLLVHDEMSVSDKVERNSDESWKEVSKRGHRVSSDRRSEIDTNLTINNFTVNDTESGQKLNRITEDTKARHHWVISGAVGTFVLAVVVLIVFAIKAKKMQ